MNIKQQFFQAFKPIMAGHGLTFKKGSFVQKNPEGWWKYTVYWKYWFPIWEINQASMSVRKNLIQEIVYNGGYADKDPKWFKSTTTMGTFVGYYHFNEGGSVQMDIESEADIPKALAYCEDIYLRIVLPFFKRFDDIEAIDRNVNDGVVACNTYDEIWKLHNNKPVKENFPIYKGLVIAKLLGRADYALLKERHLLAYPEDGSAKSKRYREVHKKLCTYLSSDAFELFLQKKRAKKDPLLAKMDKIRYRNQSQSS